MERMHRAETAKAQNTRASLISAAGELMRFGGPSAVTYRKTAEIAGAAPSSVGYYFDSIDDLLIEAAAHNIDLWLSIADEVADYAESLTREECFNRLSELVVRAILPENIGNDSAHYLQIIDGSNHAPVVEQYRKGRLMVDGTVARIMSHAGLEIRNPRMITTLVDGAAIFAIAEGSSVRDTSRKVLNEAFNYVLSRKRASS